MKQVASSDLVSCLSYSFILKMEATCSFQMLGDFQGQHGVTFQKIEVLSVLLQIMFTRLPILQQ
jgi:hypothetical protein